MKFTGFFLFMFCLQVSARSNAQRLTLSERDAPLERVFSQIKKQTGYTFAYTASLLRGARRVTVQVKNGTLEQVLDLCFKDQPLSYTIIEKTIVVKERPKSPNLSLQVQQEPDFSFIEVKGRVVNEKGDPVAGATIQVKGTAKRTITSEQGEFILSGVEEHAVLIITGAEFVTQEVKVSGASIVQVVLKQRQSSLDEMVVIAYGTTTKRFNTGSVGKVGKAEIDKQPVTNPMAALQGRVSGAFIQTQNGLPGGEISIQIRGRGSIASGTDPLYIVDGVPYGSTSLSRGNLADGIQGSINPLNSISPSDIESIEILRDADATAIYGSRAANGVVLITTRKGKSGKTRLDINLSHGISKITSRPDFLNLQEYLELRREAFKNSGQVPSADASSSNYAPDLTIWDQNKSTDWVEYMLGGTTNTSQLQGSLSGGNGKTSFLISGNYRNEETFLLQDSRYIRGGAHLNIQHASSDNKLEVSASVTYTADNSNLSNASKAVLNFAPNFAVYEADGSFNWSESRNPVAEAGKTTKNKSDNLVTSATFSYRILPGLSLRTNVGYSKYTLDQLMLNPRSTLNPAIYSANYALYGNGTRKSTIVEPQLNYALNSGKAKLDLLIGSTWQKSITEGYQIRGEDYSNESLFESFAAARTLTQKNSNYSQYKYASIFSRATLNWARRYIVNASVRRDGSSRFGPGNQFGNFGALGAAWIFTEEAFINRNIPFLSYGKLRASYGITGNDQIPDYQYLALYNPVSTPYQGVSGLNPSRISNAAYRWESTKKLEAALDLGFLSDRILTTIAWYRNRSDNQLVSYKIPYQTGFASYQANFPALIQNTGWELELNTSNIQKVNWSWKTSLNVTFPKNRLLEYPGIESSSYATTYIVGKDLDVVQAYMFAGIDPQTGDAQYVTASGALTNSPSSATDRRAIGKTSPDLYGGLHNSLSFKGFQIDALLQFTKQHSYARGVTAIPGSSMNNDYKTLLQRWQQPGDITHVPKASLGRDYYYLFSTAAWENTSYLRLKNVALSYTVPRALSQKARIEQCRLYINAQNLLTFTPSKNGYDPEIPLNSIPPVKTVVAGIQLIF